MLLRIFWISLVIFLSIDLRLDAQSLPAGFPVLEEALRRKQLLGEYDEKISFFQRPLPIFSDSIDERGSLFDELEIGSSKILSNSKKNEKYFGLLPLLNTTRYNSSRPYGWGNGALNPGVGMSNYITGGLFVKYHFLKFQLMPEFVMNQNLGYQGFSEDFSDNTLFARYRFWNFGDNPERFSKRYNFISTWGQSYLSMELGPVDLGVSNENIWWGPGQFNALIFSRNARGFKHAFLKTNKPIDIFIGHLEATVISGRLESSGVRPSQSQNLNDRFFLPFNGDWRYVNGVSISIQPKFFRGFHLGFNRTFQQFRGDMDGTIGDVFPIFEVFQKEKLFDNNNSVNYDSKGQDQQVSVFSRYHNSNGKFEVYFEFGKRDHNYNWRDFVLNPEHARAYLFGFTKLFSLNNHPDRMVQIRGEITQQKESINRYIRYPDLGSGNTSWHTHYQVRGFSHYGESLGVGIGVGSNVQTFEVSLVDKLNKVGILLERLENNQDFYYRVFGENPERKPWIDLSLGILLDHRWERFLISSKLQLINARNYQWQLEPRSTPDFPIGQKKFSILAQSHLIFLLNSK